MREIKFRGQDKDGNYVYGDLIHGVGYKAGKYYILPPNTNLALVPNCDPLDGVEVDEKSLGQYTGIKDETGREIYEGDIVCIEMHTGVSFVGTVSFDKSAFIITDEDGVDEFLHEYLEDYDYITVLGNIYENPELLEKEE